MRYWWETCWSLRQETWYQQTAWSVMGGSSESSESYTHLPATHKAMVVKSQ
jgi:hypothetical protein